MKVTITATSGPAQGQHFEFDQPDCFLFGRTKDARISLPDDPYVSRQHFLLEICPPSCRVTDLDSKNGTFVNGVRFGGRKAPEAGMRLAPKGVTGTRLNNNDEIVVGDTRMRVSISTSTDGVHEDTKTMAGAAHTDPAQMDSEVDAERTLLEPPPVITQDTPAISSQKAPIPILSPLWLKGVPEGDERRTKCPPHLPLPHLPLANKDSLIDAPSIEGYHIASVLGQGGMGRIYKAVCLKTGRDVAIKMLIPQVPVSFEKFRAFHREIEVTRQLRHPNIVELLDLGKIKGAYYCILELVKGTDLRSLIKSCKGAIALDDATPLIFGILEGLSYAHRQDVTLQASGRTMTTKGIVHRDLKPENILLEQDGSRWIPKVADFGLSKSFETAGLTDMTIAGVTGTPPYWPREQITHYKFLHPATDVFSIAAVFFEMLTGIAARPGLKQTIDRCRAHKREPEISDYMLLIGNNPIPPICVMNPKIPKAVGNVIDRALRETEVPVDEVEMRKILAALRYPDAGCFRDALLVAYEESGISV